MMRGKSTVVGNSKQADLDALAQALIRSAGTGIFIIQDGIFKFINHIMEGISGYTKEELLGQYAQDYIYPDDRESVRCRAIASLKGQSLLPYEYRFISKSGQVLWILERITSIEYEGRRAALGSFMDITGRKKAEEALVESENKYRTLFESSKDAIYITTREGKFLDFNSSALNLLGYTNEEMVNLDVHCIYADPKDREKFRREIERKGSIRDYEVKFLRKSGALVDCLLTSSLRLASDGSIIGYQGIIRDITEQKRANKELTESEESYRLLLQTVGKAGEGIFILQNTETEEAIIIYANNQLSLMAGYPEKALISKSLSHILATDVYPSVMEKYERGLSGEDLPSRYTTGLTHSDGTSVPVDVVVNSMTYKGKPAMLCCVRDMTERNLIEEELLHSKERFRRLSEAAFEGIGIHKRGVIIDANKAAAELFGCSLSEFIGKHTIEFVVPASRDIVLKNAVARSEEPYEAIGLRADGTTFPMELRNKPIHYSNEHNVLVTAIRDITQRKQEEDELRNSREQLRSLSAHLETVIEDEKKYIAREIHDELGQVLTALKMDVSWLSKRITRNQAALLEKTKSMAQLIDTTIESVERISARLRPGILDHLGLISAIKWEAKQFSQRTGISCDVAVVAEDINLPQDLSTAIFRIFKEALTNAARHSNATSVNVNLTEKGGEFILEIRDNGRGIEKTDISHPTSFGLLGIRERVYFFGGTFKITGVRNKGTKLVATIPLHGHEAKSAC